jgi:SNF2 family DNA or RNA helicase
MTSYNDFLESKQHSNDNYGFNPHFLPDCLYDFQKALVEWSVRKGRAAIFADCGLGKTVMQLVFAQNTIEKTNKPALIVTPLSVNFQTVQEGEKFDIEVNRSIDGKPQKNITVTNYEKLHLFSPDDYGTVVLDESSAIKNFDGKRRLIVTDFIRKIPYRLLCTATAAPNDYIELGTSAEVLSVMGRMNMLSTFFINDENSNYPIWWGARWRFKKHAESRFWRWICSWARAVKKPSDIGFSDEGYILPPLEIEQTVVKCDNKLDGMLFKMPAVTLNEQREERKKTLQERCEKVYEKVQGHERSVVWCHLNDEGDLLEKLIPNSKQVKGAQKDEQKEEILNAFSKGELPIIITKPKIGAWGLNWQHCNHMTFFPSHSFEQFYQGVRRCWRFGQMYPVKVDIITSEGESGVMKNLERKAEAAQKMFEMMVGFMNDAIKINDMTNYDKKVRLPNWL